MAVLRVAVPDERVVLAVVEPVVRVALDVLVAVAVPVERAEVAEPDARVVPDDLVAVAKVRESDVRAVDDCARAAIPDVRVVAAPEVRAIAVVWLSNVRAAAEERVWAVAGATVRAAPEVRRSSRALVKPLLRCENERSGLAVA